MKMVRISRSRGERNIANLNSVIRDSLVEKATLEKSLKDLREEAMTMSGKSIPGARSGGGEVSKCQCPGARGAWCDQQHWDSVQLGKRGREEWQEVRSES